MVIKTKDNCNMLMMRRLFKTRLMFLCQAGFNRLHDFSTFTIQQKSLSTHTRDSDRVSHFFLLCPPSSSTTRPDQDVISRYQRLFGVDRSNLAGSSPDWKLSFELCLERFQRQFFMLVSVFFPLSQVLRDMVVWTDHTCVQVSKSSQDVVVVDDARYSCFLSQTFVYLYLNTTMHHRTYCTHSKRVSHAVIFPICSTIVHVLKG